MWSEKLKNEIAFKKNYSYFQVSILHFPKKVKIIALSIV